MGTQLVGLVLPTILEGISTGTTTDQLYHDISIKKIELVLLKII